MTKGYSSRLCVKIKRKRKIGKNILTRRDSPISDIYVFQSISLQTSKIQFEIVTKKNNSIVVQNNYRLIDNSTRDGTGTGRRFTDCSIYGNYDFTFFM
jgi:hypothetical protein